MHPRKQHRILWRSPLLKADYENRILKPTMGRESLLQSPEETEGHSASAGENRPAVDPITATPEQMIDMSPTLTNARRRRSLIMHPRKQHRILWRSLLLKADYENRILKPTMGRESLLQSPEGTEGHSASAGENRPAVDPITATPEQMIDMSPLSQTCLAIFRIRTKRQHQSQQIQQL